MRIILEKKTLIRAVGIVSRFAETKHTTLPALKGVLIVAGDDGIHLRATNLEVVIDLKIKGECKEEGVVLVPAQTLKDICANQDPQGSIELSKEQETLTIHTGGSISTIKTLAYEDFPLLQTVQKEKASLTLKHSEVETLLQSIIPYASTSSIRPELASVYFSCSGNTLTTVATDSFRLAEKKITIPNTTKPFTLLIPAKNLNLITQALPQEDIVIHTDDNQCTFAFSEGTITTRLTQGTYPDYTQIIPKSFISETTVLKKDFEYSLKRTAVFADTFQKITIQTNPEKKELTISAKNNDVGVSEEHIQGSVVGEPVSLSFNHRYISAPLQAMKGETITISISGIGRATTLRGTGDSSFLYLVMPMNQ